MQGILSHRVLFEPRTMREALGLLKNEGPLVPMAGCTDLYVALNFGTLAPSRFLNLWRLDALKRIETRGGRLVIGALATHAAIARSPLVARRLPSLAAACREIGGVQIQNRGTIGGNVANASPAGDTLPVLSVSGALVVIASAAGTRRVPFESFYTGYRQTVLGADELIAGFEFRPLPGRPRHWFRKVGTRAAQAIAKVVVAGIRFEDGSVRLAAGSVAPTVVRLRQTEEALARDRSIDTAVSALQGEIAPIDDLRSTAEYRRAVAANLVRRFWADTQHG